MVYGYRFVFYIKPDDVFKDIAEGDEKRLDTSNYELERSLAKRKNKNVIDLMNQEHLYRIFVGNRNEKTQIFRNKPVY